MTDEDRIKDGFRQFLGSQRKTKLLPAIVINSSNDAVDVKDVDDNEIFDVRLQAAIAPGGKGIRIVPAVDSWVLIANIGLSENAWAVVSVSEVEKVIWEIEDTRLEIDAAGLEIVRKNEDLKTLIGELIDALQQLTVTCSAPGSPSSPPINAPAFALLKTRFNSLLK